MVRKRQRTSDRCKWSEEVMLKAVSAVQSNEMLLSTAARTFDVPRNSLRRRVNSVSQIPKFGQKTTFSRDIEIQLVQFLLQLDEIGFGLTVKELRCLVYRFAVVNDLKHPFNNELQMAGIDWVRGFLSRHNTLSIRVSESISFGRAIGFNKDVVLDFFVKLRNLMEVHKLGNDPSKIFNCDETGLQLVYKPSKVISQSGKRVVVCQTNQEKGETVSVMICASASGHYIPPFVIMKGKRWKDDYELGMPPGTKVVLSDSGYMKWDVFSKFLDHFISSKPNGSVILILDGHRSHFADPGTLEKALQHNIFLFCLPSNCTHKLQPLDVSFFAPLKTYYNEACRSYIQRYPGKGLSKIGFGDIFANAWKRAATVGNIVNGFKRCGIFPFDPNCFLNSEFAPSTVHDHFANQNAQNQGSLDEKKVENPNLKASQIKTKVVKKIFKDIHPLPKTTSNRTKRKRTSREAKLLSDQTFIEELKKKKSLAASKLEKQTNKTKQINKVKGK